MRNCIDSSTLALRARPDVEWTIDTANGEIDIEDLTRGLIGLDLEIAEGSWTTVPTREMIEGTLQYPRPSVLSPSSIADSACEALANLDVFKALEKIDEPDEDGPYDFMFDAEDIIHERSFATSD